MFKHPVIRKYLKSFILIRITVCLSKFKHREPWISMSCFALIYYIKMNHQFTHLNNLLKNKNSNKKIISSLKYPFSSKPTSLYLQLLNFFIRTLTGLFRSGDQVLQIHRSYLDPPLSSSPLGERIET